MNKNIVLSVLSIFTMLTLVGSGTYAYFSNSATSTNNVFASGTLDLKLANGSGSFSDSVTASFGGPALSPGSCLPVAVVNLKNTGSVAANHIDITATNTSSAFAAFLKIKTLTLDGNDIVIADSNSNGLRDLQDFAAAGIINKAFSDFSVHPFSMEVCLDASAGNAQQGQTNTLDMTFFLDQGPHS